MIENFTFKTKYSIDDLLEIIAILRSENGCPWDREQTHSSIKFNFIEECYEVVEAINLNDKELLQEELGDVLMQILLHCQMEAEEKAFDFSDVCDELAKKLIIRHPHVFAEENCSTSLEVLETWEKVKNETKNRKSVTSSMTSIPKELPALMRAQKVQKKAAKFGFDWKDISGAVEKIHSECDEFEKALDINDIVNAKEELGDLLFSCVNASRFINTDSEEALNEATNKFISRFEIVENLASQRAIDMKEASLEELDKLWDEAKLILK